MSNNYWEKRKAQRMWEHMQRAEDTADEIAKVYYQASRYVSHEISSIFNKYKTKHGLNEKEAKKLLNTLQNPSSYQEMLTKLKATTSTSEKKELIKILESPAYRSRINRLEKLQSDIDVMMKSVYEQEKAFNTVNYIEVAHDAYYKSIYDIQGFTGYAFGFNQLDPQSIDKVLNSTWSGVNYSERIWNNTQTLANELKEQLLMSMITGKTENEISQELANKFSTSSFNARRLIRTESNFVASALEALSYEECGAKKYIFLATLDLRTSDTCRSHDLKKYLLKKRKVGVNYPPMHVWCRSTTIIYLNKKTLDNIQRRARDPKTGETYVMDKNISYSEWMKEQNKKYGVDNVKTFEKKVKHLNADKKQMKRYQYILGRKNVPKSIEAFQELKYNDNVSYSLLNDLYKGEKQGRILQNKFDYIDNDGKKLFIPQGSKFNNVGVMAGNGVQNELRIAPLLVDKYGGHTEEWQKKYGKVVSDKYIFDLHWYDLNNKQYEMKLKLRKDNVEK